MVTELLGLILILAGFYFLGQNFTFYPHYYHSSHTLYTVASIIFVLGGIASVIFFRRQTGQLGWAAIAIGLVLFLSNGRIYIKPANLWNYLLAFAALIFGCQLVTKGKVKF